ncbi:MAG: VOC family protein [Oceanicaulis sp.]|nr:VOC family protein [Oceanicaulis sp.]
MTRSTSDTGRETAAPVRSAEPVIEHVNLTVADPEHTSGMLQAVFGWRERWRGRESDGRIGIHVGGADSYVSLYPPRPPAKAHLWPKSRPFNHLGVEVADLEACEVRVRQLGLRPYGHGDYAPGRRFYFMDEDGVEYEVVSYAAGQGHAKVADTPQSA